MTGTVVQYVFFSVRNGSFYYSPQFSSYHTSMIFWLLQLRNVLLVLLCFADSDKALSFTKFPSPALVFSNYQKCFYSLSAPRLLWHCEALKSAAPMFFPISWLAVFPPRPFYCAHYIDWSGSRQCLPFPNSFGTRSVSVPVVEGVSTVFIPLLGLNALKVCDYGSPTH